MRDESLNSSTYVPGIGDISNVFISINKAVFTLLSVLLNNYNEAKKLQENIWAYLIIQLNAGYDFIPFLHHITKYKKLKNVENLISMPSSPLKY